jgi:carboxyl-terminal processing protease
MLALGMLFGYLMADKQAGISLLRFSKAGQDQNSGVVNEVYQLMSEKYLFEPDFKVVEDDALFNIFSHTDPYSLYISPKDIEAVNSSMEGNFKGLGIEMLNIRDTLVIADIIPGSPAMKIGLKN